MKRFLRIVKWLFLCVGLFLLLSAIGISLYTRTENFTRWAREESVAAVNELIRGSVSVERLEGSVWGHLTLYKVALRYEEQEIVQVPRLDVSFSLLPLLWGQVKIAAITAAQPHASLAQDRDGKWNVLEALSPRQPQPEKPSTLALSIRSLLLDDGDVDVRLASDGKSYRLQHLRLDSTVGILPESISFEARELSTGFLPQDYPELRLKGAVEYQQRPKEPASVKIKNFWAVSTNSRLKLNGEIIPGEPLKIKAEGILDKLAPSDVRYFVSRWPLKPDITGRIAVDGALDALEGTVQLAGAGAKIDGKFAADLAQDSPTYSATMTLGAFDLRRWLGDDKRVAGVMNATVVASGTGFGLKDTDGRVRVEVQSAQAQGWALGSVAVQGRLQKSIASIDGQLKSKLGGANLSGKIALGDKRPGYELTLAVKDLDVQQVASNGTTVSSKLNLQGAVKGSGFSPAEMNTRVDVQISPSSVGPVNVKQGAVNAILQSNRVRIARASLDTAESTLSASGEIGLDAKMTGKLDYRFRTTDAGPWLSLVSLKGAGALDLTGQAQGNLADLETRGSAQLSRLKVEGSGLKDGNVAYNLRASMDQIFPQGVVTAHLSDVDAGLALRRFDATAKLSRQPSRSIQVNLSAQDNHERKHALSGTVDLLPDAINMHLSQASLSAPDGVWKLVSPATVSKNENGISIAQLALKNGERELSLNGTFAFSGKQDLALNIDRLPVETVTGFMSQPPKMSGLLAAQARITGTAVAPEVTASARLTNATIAGQAYAGANAEANYRNKRASLRLIVQQDSSHVLNGSGAVPLDLSWSSGWRAEFANGMELRAQSTGLSLAFANAFSGKAVQDIGGEVSIDVSARGSIKQPDLRGTFGLRDGKLKIVPLGVDINGIALAGNMDSRMLSVRQLVAKAKDGEIRGSGSLALKDYDISAVKLALTAERWPAIQTQRYQARIGGNVDVQGSLTAPRMTGQLNIIDGSLRPDLAFLEQNKVPLKRDETIVIVNHRSVADLQAQGQQRGGANENDLFKKLSLDLTLRAPGNLWIRHPDLVAELSGNIRATKKPERNVDLTGRIDVVRGSLAFQGRRFQLTRGAIQFTGGDKINPTLDIAAQYKLPEYEVDAAIAGTAEKPSLTLTSQPRLEQADILALLLFGRPINALSQNERGSVQQSAVSITSGYVAGKIASSVSQALGLDTLGVDLREVDFSGGRVGFGHYVGSNTYVSLSQQLSGDHGQQVSMEYQLTPEWKIGTSGGTTGANNGVDIIWHKRY